MTLRIFRGTISYGCSDSLYERRLSWIFLSTVDMVLMNQIEPPKITYLCLSIYAWKERIMKNVYWFYLKTLVCPESIFFFSLQMPNPNRKWFKLDYINWNNAAIENYRREHVKVYCRCFISIAEFQFLLALFTNKYAVKLTYWTHSLSEIRNSKS